MADPLAAARNFLNAMERIPSIIDQYKAKNEVLEREIPQLQEIAGKVWKKEDELKAVEVGACRPRPQRYSWSLRRHARKSPKRRTRGSRSSRKRKMRRNRQAQYPERCTAADTQSGG